MYNNLKNKSILKNRYEVIKSDMNILKNKSLSFVRSGLFTTEKEWIHPERLEETYEIIYVVKGEVYMNDDGRQMCVSKGQALLLYPGIRHFGYKKSSAVSFYWLHFKVTDGTLPLPAGLYESIDNAYLFKELLHLSVLPKRPEYAVSSVLCHILSLLLLQYERERYGRDRLSEEIYEWIRINSSAALCARDVALHFGFSEDHLTRILKKSFGVGAKQLICRFTLEYAKELLCNTGKYVKEIAAELDFPSDKAFIAFFKYHEGIYPSDFRDKFNCVHMNSR